MADAIPLRDARRQLGIGDSTIRRWIHKGKLHAEERDGLYGPELWVSLADVEALAKQRRAQGLFPAAAPPSPDTIPLGKLITWAQHPFVTVEFFKWLRSTSATPTPHLTLTWIREQLTRGDRG